MLGKVGYFWTDVQLIKCVNDVGCCVFIIRSCCSQSVVVIVCKVKKQVKSEVCNKDMVGAVKLLLAQCCMFWVEVFHVSKCRIKLFTHPSPMSTSVSSDDVIVIHCVREKSKSWAQFHNWRQIKSNYNIMSNCKQIINNLSMLSIVAGGSIRSP